MIDQEHVDQFADWFATFIENVGVVIKGKRDEIAMVLVAVLSEGHVLLEDHPGTGKTSLAKSVAQLFSGEFKRVQFTPDLLPADITGGLVYNQRTTEFESKPGPIFTNVLLADEINRASPKTQAALLEAMEERQVTIGNDTHVLDRPFVVIATQNPDEEMSGTYELPDAQLDRFLIRHHIGYPSVGAESEMLRGHAEGITPSVVPRLMSADDLVSLIEIAASVHVGASIRNYIATLAKITREDLPDVRIGLSPRGCIALMRASRTVAASDGRVFVRADDVKDVARPVIAHRLRLTPQAEMRHVELGDLIDRAFERVPAPDVGGID